MNSNFDELDIMPKQNIVYFNSNHSRTRMCSGKLAASMELSWTLVSTWSEMTQALQVDNALLAVHVDMMNQAPINSVIDFMDALGIVTKSNPGYGKIKIGVVIMPTTLRSVIKDLQKTQCQGILLKIGEYSCHDINQSMKALGSGIPYWPRHILDQLPGTVKKIVNSDNIALTNRQTQVFDHIVTRGASNKAIAKSLGISESTVKLHVSEIFKRYGVKTRTQLAVFSNT